MDAFLQLLRQGGPVMIPLVLLSLLLYERSFGLYFMLRRARRQLNGLAPDSFDSLSDVRRLRTDLTETFQQHRFVIATLIAAAPLLGLLGTVSGMVSTFQSLIDRTGQKSMEGLADGISIALITTETGLAVAIPAVILLHFAQRQMQHGEQRLVNIESSLMETV